MKLARIEALSDGIFAIVMTLLVLELSVPAVHESVNMSRDLAMGLIALWPKFLSFVASFIILGIYWGGHHLIFNQLKRASFHYSWLNIIFLLSISSIPFSTALLGEYSRLSLAQSIYGINLIICGLLLYSLWTSALRQRFIDVETISPELKHNARSKILLPAFVYFWAIILSIWHPEWSIYAFIVGPIIYFIPVDTKAWQIIAPRKDRRAA
jgi:uncharacterized membrane protein